MSHYYELTNAGVIPRHFVDVASRPGELRPTTIRDAKKFGWTPSVTTILNLLDKPALTDWKIQEHLKVAFQDQLSGHELDTWWIDLEVYCREIKGKTQDALNKAPKDGTDFHDELEQWFSGTYTGDRRTLCESVGMLLEDSCGVQSWTPEKSFVDKMGFAGKVDLHSAEWVLDWKTKNTADKWKPKKMAYQEMCRQLAAYRVGLGLHNARCANVFICLDTGELEFYEWDPETLDRAWATFTDLLRIWLREAQYTPKTC